MNLSEQLNTDLREAVRAGDARRRDVIRFLRAAITNAAIEKRGDLSDAEIQNIIRQQIKQRRDSIQMFRSGGRHELAEEEEAQIAVLQHYLPAQMRRDEIVALVRRVADEVGATSPKDMSRIMPALIKAADGRAEGRTLSEVAKEELARRAGSGVSS